MAGPLEGIRVLDFTIAQQGPNATLVLRELGAEVIKVEQRGVGDISRLSARDRDRDVSFAFLTLNRGKKDITLDLKTEKGRKIALALGEISDVVVENYRPGVMAKLGLDYEDFRAVNPRVIYASASAFGRQGRWASKPGLDILAQAATGLAAVTGEEGDPPIPAGAALADHIGALNLALGILAALFYRERTGKGQRLDSSLVGGLLYAQAWELGYRTSESAPDAEAEDHREYDLTRYRLQVRLDRGGRLTVTAEVTFVPRQPHLRVIRFALFPKLRVERAWDAERHPLPFLQADEEEGYALAVIFPDPLPVGVPRTVIFEYSGSGAVRPSGPGNYILVPEARATWYPNNWQMPFGDRATFEVAFTIPRDLTIIATGQRHDLNPETSYWTSEWPMAVAGFNVGLFRPRQRTEDNFTIEVYTNLTEPDEIRRVQLLAERLEQQGVRLELPLGSLTTSGLAEGMLAEATNAVRIFTRYFGPNPYGRIALSQQPAAFFGQSWPMLVYLPYTAFLDGTQRRALGLPVRFSEFTDVVGAHEIAHQWWGHIVSWKTYRDQWMSEGFSDFAAALYLQFAFHADPERRLQRFLDFWRSQRELITQKALLGVNRMSLEPYRVGPLILGARLNTGRTSGAYQRLVYAKGAFVLHMLRMMLRDPRAPLGQGDDRFIAMMHEFTRTYAHRAASTRDFQRLVETYMTPEMDLDGNRSMDWFFRQWVYGTALPHYTLQYRLRPAPNGRHHLWLKITQSRVPEDFQMLIPVYLDDGRGKLTRLGVAMLRGNGAAETEVLLPARPERVLLNAFEDVLCTKEEKVLK